MTYDEFITALPEFENFKFSDTQLKSFKNWIPIVSKTFDPSVVGGDEETQNYCKALFVAHIARLRWLPSNGLAPAIVLGDTSSQSAGEGKINVSYSRISQQDFLLDPYLSLTPYGSELAFYLRTDGSTTFRVLG